MVRRAVIIAVLAVVGYVGFWPTGADPAPWVPPPVLPPPPLNDALKNVEWLGKDLPGPEAITFDTQGRLVTGLKDGRIVRITPTGRETLGNTGGRVLGLKYASDGVLYICDKTGGLMSLGTDGKLATLADGFLFADDLDFDADGAVYFSDASQRNDVDHFTRDLIEHQTTGRLMKYDPNTKKASVLASGFQFSNGVAFGPDRSWLLVAETGNYRLTRVDLDGKISVFADSLPGFPDNITWSQDRQVFWVAIGSPRNALIDTWAPYPFIRQMVLRLPKSVQPKPEAHAMALAFDVNGKLVQNLQWKDPAAYSPIASVIEHDGSLYLGSFALGGYGRYRLP